MPLAKLTDDQLLDLLKEGNESAFCTIYQRYGEMLYCYAWNILKDEAECKDVVQEVFVWFWENRTKLQITILKFYLLAAVKYKLIRAIRNSKRRNEILSARQIQTASYMEETVELKELQSVILQFTQNLPPRAKEIFHLSRNEYLTNREIAARMQISEKTVENQMTITLKKLKHTLGKMSFWIVFL